MARRTNILSTLAVLAVASAPAPAESTTAANLLEATYRAASRLSPCAASAQDLAGDVALRLWARHRHVLETDHLRPYVETSVRNAWRDQLRKQRRTPLFSEVFPDGSLGVQGDRAESGRAPVPDPIESTCQDPLAHAAAEEFRDSLSPSDRDVLDHLEAGRNDREIAPLMNRTRHWVRRSVERIRQQARVHFLEEATAPPV